MHQTITAPPVTYLHYLLWCVWDCELWRCAVGVPTQCWGKQTPIRRFTVQFRPAPRRGHQERMGPGTETGRVKRRLFGPISTLVSRFWQYDNMICLETCWQKSGYQLPLLRPCHVKGWNVLLECWLLAAPEPLRWCGGHLSHRIPTDTHGVFRQNRVWREQ